MEPLRLWYRISAITETQDATKLASPVETPKRQRKTKKKPLVDITDGRNQRPAKRRKRTPPPADEDDVKLSTLLPDASKPKQADTGPVESSQAKTEDNNNKTNAIFDRSTEFSCSTPLPEAETKVKPSAWLPKAVFDLDDRDLFAKRLQKITKEESEPSGTPVEAKEDERSEETEKPAEPMSPSSPLNPLRICVTPEPSGGANEAVHDSIGALDLSGSSKSDGETSQTQQPSPGTSAVKTPHPYFMTPIFEKKKEPMPSPKLPIQKPAVKLSPLPMLSPVGSAPIMKSPLWNLINQVPMNGADKSKAQPHKTLFDFFKSNPFLFKPTTSGAQKSPKVAANSNKNTATSPKSI